MTSGIGQFVKPPTAKGDRVQAQTLVGHHLLVWVKELKQGVKTKFNSGPAANASAGNEGVVVDVYVLDTNQPYIGVMWMAGAIKDGLKQYVGDGSAYPIEIFQQQGGANGWYLDIRPLEGEWLAHAQQNLAGIANLVAQTRAAKEQEWAAAAATAVPTGPPAIPGMAPMAPPQQPMAPQAPAGPPAFQAVPPQAPVAMPQAPAAAPQQPQYQAPQYAPPAAPAAAPPQQFQPPAAPQAAPPAQFAPPQAASAAPPAAPGAMTNASVADLQAQLNQIG